MEVLDNFFWVPIAAIAAFLLYRFLRYGGLRGLLYGSAVARTIGELELGQFVHEDWRAMHEHYGDPECTKHTFRRPLSEGESWRAMASMVGHWRPNR